jgi:hypothetical protein
MTEPDPGCAGREPGCAGQEALIGRLAGDLRPVRRMPPPGLLTAAWCAVLVALALLLAGQADLAGLRARLMFVPDMWLSVAGSGATAVLAAVAAFQGTVPDRSPRWALLPLPALLVWIAASGMGCLRDWLVPGTHAASMPETRICLFFILGLSVPLSLLLLLLLRRGYVLHPHRTALLGGLAVAAAAATLLNFFHPYDAAATDLLVHAAAVAMVIAANRAWGSRLLAPGTR